jgi:hypothetical protein
MFDLLLGQFGGWIAAAAAFVTALAAMWFGGRKSAKTAAKLDAAEAAAQSTEDMNNVDTMRNADDAARVERLREFAKRNGRP